MGYTNSTTLCQQLILWNYSFLSFYSKVERKKWNFYDRTRIFDFAIKCKVPCVLYFKTTSYTTNLYFFKEPLNRQKVVLQRAENEIHIY